MPILDPKDPEQMHRFQAFVSSVHDAHFIQDPRWEYVQGHLKAEYVTVEENGQIIAATAAYIRPVGWGMSLIYCKRGPVTRERNADSVLRLIEEMKPLIHKYRAFAVRFDPNWEDTDQRISDFTEHGFRIRGRGYTKRVLVMSRRTMSFPIEGKTMDDLMAGFKSRTRRDINKSLRSGLQIEEGFTPEHLDTFMEILEITCKRDAISHMSREFFRRIGECFDRDEARLYLVKKEDTYLSAAVAMNYGGRMYYYHSGSTNEQRNLYPNARMQYQLLSWAVESRCHTYDMGGIVAQDPKDGLYLFKSGYCNGYPMEEYIGELDYPIHLSVYRLFIALFDAMQHIRMWIFERKNHK